jgi:hypothetical protein
MATALRTSIIAAVRTAVTALALPGSKGTFIRKGPRASASERYPCVVVQREDNRADDLSRLTFHYDDGGPWVRVMYLFGDPLGGDADVDRIDQWHETIRKAFMEPETLRALVPGVWGCDVTALPELDPDDRAYQHVVGGVLLKIRTFETRGVGA